MSALLTLTSSTYTYFYAHPFTFCFLVTIEKPQNSKWMKFNYDQIGYYRVNYPEEQWRNFMENYNSLSTSDRTHLLEEAFSIAEAGQLSYNIPLEFTKKLTKERDYTPWSVAYSKLATILNYLTGSNSAQEENLKVKLVQLK